MTTSQNNHAEDLLQFIWNKRKLIILITAVAAIAAVIYSLVLKEKYKSKIDFRPDIGINKDLPINKVYEYGEQCIDSGVFNGIDLYDDGNHEDEQANDGIYGGKYSVNQTSGTIKYYLTAFDSQNQTGRFPRCGEIDLNYNPEVSKLVINELMASNEIAYADSSGEYDDWIELYNNTSSPIDLFGYYLKDNFNYPYISTSFAEFWRRWHITLSNWMRDYLYIPLGGNRVKSKVRLYFNLWMVFLISGFWHGAAWTFIAWGIFHGAFLILDRLFLLRFYKMIGKPISILITFIITLVGWVIFRAETFPQAMSYIATMFDFGNIDLAISTTRGTYDWFIEQRFLRLFVIPFILTQPN